MNSIVLDVRGSRRSPVAIKGYKPTKAPATKGRQYPPDPLSVEDIVSLMHSCKPHRNGNMAVYSALRLRALIVILWRTGLRISEALALEERDLNQDNRSIVVRRGKAEKEE